MIRITCPLCKSTNTKLVERISTCEINRAYLRNYGIQTEFQTDEISYLVCTNCNLGFFNPSVTGNEELYEQLQQFDWYYMSDKPEYHLAKKYLPAKGNVLEVGAGKAAFAEIVGKDRYIGLEFNDEAIIRAKSIDINLVKESVENHAIRHGEQYAAVVSFQVLEHVSNPSTFIRACIDSLQPGGNLILAVPNHDGICGLAQNSILDIPPHHVSHWSEKTMAYIAVHYNLDLLSVDFETVADFHAVWGARSIYESKLKNILGIKSKLLDTSLLAKLLGKIASIFARISPPDLSTIKGHTVLACYRKRGE